MSTWPYWSNGKRRVWFDDPDPGPTLPPVPQVVWVLELDLDGGIGPLICPSCGRVMGWSCSEDQGLCVTCLREESAEAPLFQRPAKTYVRTAVQRDMWRRLWLARSAKGRSAAFRSFGRPWGTSQ